MISENEIPEKIVAANSYTWEDEFTHRMKVSERKAIILSVLVLLLIVGVFIGVYRLLPLNAVTPYIALEDVESGNHELMQKSIELYEKDNAVILKENIQ